MAKKNTSRSPRASKPKGAAAKTNYGGFGTAAAQKAAAQGYLGAASGFTKIKTAPVEAWLASQGLNQGQPVGIGGMRFTDEAGNLTTQGQRSDVPFGNKPVGQAYDSTTQDYFKAYSKASRNPTKGRNTRPLGGKRTGGGTAIDTQFTEGSYEAAPSTTVEPIYAEADLTRTGYGAAQGKAYGKGEGSSSRGATGGGASKTTGGKPGESTGPKRKGVTKRAKKRITAAKKAGNYTKAQKIRAHARAKAKGK